MDISYLKRRKDGDLTAALVGWVPFLPATEGDFNIEVPPETTILDLMKEYRVDKWVNVSQAASEKQTKLRGKRQQRMTTQDNYQKDAEMDLEGFALTCAERYIKGWRDFYTKVPIEKDEWEQLDKKHRRPEEASYRTEHYFKRIDEPFNLEMAVELVQNHWIVGFSGLMIDQTQLLSLLIDEDFGEQLKNS